MPLIFCYLYWIGCESLPIVQVCKLQFSTFGIVHQTKLEMGKRYIAAVSDFLAYLIIQSNHSTFACIHSSALMIRS